MKRLLIITALMGCMQTLFGQKGSSQFGFVGGYERFTEIGYKDGYNVGIEFKHYVKDRIFVVGNFHAGVNDGSVHTTFSGYNQSVHTLDLRNSVHDYMLGCGPGYVVLSIGRHRIYIKATAGLGNTDRIQQYAKLEMENGHEYRSIVDNQQKYTKWALTTGAGYDFRVTDWLAVGINYTGFRVGNNYNNGYNLKVSWLF